MKSYRKLQVELKRTMKMKLIKNVMPIHYHESIIFNKKISYLILKKQFKIIYLTNSIALIKTVIFKRNYISIN